MPARNKTKWLTRHALRSGLAEQWATESAGIMLTVELRWIKATDTYQVMTMRGRQIDTRTQYPSLVDARAGFTKEQRRASSPREGTGR